MPYECAKLETTASRMRTLRSESRQRAQLSEPAAQEAYTLGIRTAVRATAAFSNNSCCEIVARCLSSEQFRSQFHQSCTQLRTCWEANRMRSCKHTTIDAFAVTVSSWRVAGVSRTTLSCWSPTHYPALESASAIRTRSGFRTCATSVLSSESCASHRCSPLVVPCVRRCDPSDS
jgi:hypothetical protein